MPLIKSGSRKAIGENISEMQAAGHPHNQAVAAALRNARQYASGGSTPKAPFQGFLHSAVPGRTDKLPISVKGGAYVLPADHVAALGQGNSLAGSQIVNQMFKMGPYGASAGGMKSAGSHMPKLKGRADGGETGGGDTDIIAAGGEIVIPPDKIMERFGDLAKGHKALDQWVVDTRKKHVETLRNLKPPKKN